jgi:hypothetical protein
MTSRTSCGYILTNAQAQAQRDAVMETLVRLYIEFAAIGKFKEASPQLDELMKIAYGELPERILRSEEYRREYKIVGHSKDVSVGAIRGIKQAQGRGR